jgi:hypothetical protein
MGWNGGRVMKLPRWAPPPMRANPKTKLRKRRTRNLLTFVLVLVCGTNSAVPQTRRELVTCYQCCTVFYTGTYFPIQITIVKNQPGRKAADSRSFGEIPASSYIPWFQCPTFKIAEPSRTGRFDSISIRAVTRKSTPIHFNQKIPFNMAQYWPYFAFCRPHAPMHVRHCTQMHPADKLSPLCSICSIVVSNSD